MYNSMSIADSGSTPIERRKPFDVTNKTFLLTGGSSGIGRETAIILSEAGARVVVSARRMDQLEITLGQMKGSGHGLEPFDLEDLDAIPEWMRKLAERYGPFDGLAHIAGVRKTIGLRGLSPKVLHETFKVNFDAAVMLAKGFRQKGCSRAPSSIVFMSSASALVGSAGTAAYASSKAALIGLTKSLAIEVARDGTRVNCIAAGIVESEMTEQIRRALSAEQFAAISAQHPLGLGSTWDVGCATAYLLSEASRWMTGHTLVLDGGFSAQ